MITVDVGHPPLTRALAEEELERALRKIELSANLRVLRVVHGYGSKGSGGTLKTFVQDWAYTKRKRIYMMIEGSRIDMFSRDVQQLLNESGLSVGDLGGTNDGVTVIWVK